MKNGPSPITPAKAAVGAALLGAFATLAVLAWPSGGSGQPAEVAEPSATATAKLAPKAPTASPTTMPTPRSELPPSRSLSFQPNESGRYFRGIYERTPDGLINLLVENPALHSRNEFSVSRDGRRLAFEYKDTLYRYERGGAEGPVPVLSFPIMNKVVMSPDGNRALVTGYRYGAEGGEATYMVDMLSGSVTGFHPEGHKPFSAAWSPDSAWISFWEQGGCDKQATYVVASNGTGLRKVADVSAESAWSPDGRRLALSAHCGGGVSLVDLDAGPIDLSATIPSPSSAGPWSPDGRLLTFITNGEIHVIDIETGLEWAVTRGYEPTWSPDGSALAFLRDGNLHISNLDGSAQSQVTFSSQPYTDSPTWLPDGSLMFAFAPPFEWAVYAKELATGLEVDLAEGREPLWSPDGTRISFVAGTSLGQGGSVDINVMGFDGQDLTRVGGQNWDDSVGPCEEGESVSWSPDSRTIAYSDGVEARVSKGDIEGAAPVVLAAGYTPAWPPGGSRLAYSSFDERGCIIRLINPDGPGEDTFLTVGSMPLWSPDGGQLAFARVRSDDWRHDVFVISGDGSDERQFTFPRGEGLKYGFNIGSWSPDGTRLALTRFPLDDSGDVASGWESGEIVLVDVANGESTRLVVNGSNPAWSPDGRQIAFIRWDVSDLPQSLTPYIYLVDADGTSEPVLLTQGEHPSWSPDGTQIAFTRYLHQ
jgi:Tol biopolymer transport system component